AFEAASRSDWGKTHGSAAGTVMWNDLGPDGTHPDQFFTAGGRLFFTANAANAAPQLWASDGTAAGTVAVHGVASGQNIFSDPAFGPTVFFTAFSGTSQSLWKTDG